MPKTEVILTHNIVGLGGESDQVKVAAGYARNYLYPQGLAIPVSGANKRRLEALRQRRAEREAHEFNTMNELSKSISKLIAVITVKTGDDGKMFGAVTSGTIADQLKAQFDITLDKKKIHLDAPIKTLGEHEVQLRLHTEVTNEARRNAIRHRLSRRLLDDPVLYADALDAETRAYFANQRGPMATRLCSAAGLSAEQRAEGLALVDEDGTLTDIAMPAEGTDAHVTLLVAELLASGYRNSRTQDVPVPVTTLAQVSAFVRRARERHGSHWRKSAREPGSEHELAAGALERLHKLQLIARSADEVRPLPALARFAVGAPRIKKVAAALPRDLFDSPSPAP